MVSNFVIDNKLWVKDLAYSEQAENKYIEWNKRQQSLTYVLKNDLQKLDNNFNENFIIKDNQHPKLLKLFLGNQIQIETICLLLKITNAIKQWDIDLEYDPTWNIIKNKILKYVPFINYDVQKVKKLCLDRFG